MPDVLILGGWSPLFSQPGDPEVRRKLTWRRHLQRRVEYPLMNRRNNSWRWILLMPSRVVLDVRIIGHNEDHRSPEIDAHYLGNIHGARWLGFLGYLCLVVHEKPIWACCPGRYSLESVGTISARSFTYATRWALGGRCWSRKVLFMSRFHRKRLLSGFLYCNFWLWPLHRWKIPILAVSAVQTVTIRYRRY